MVKEFEALRQPLPIEVPYDQGRDEILRVTERAFVLGEKQQDSPFIVALRGTPNSGKTHLAREFLQEFTGRGLSVQRHTDHQNFGKSGGVSLQENVEPFIQTLQRIPDFRVQIFNPTLAPIPPNDPLYKIQMRINNPQSVKK